MNVLPLSELRCACGARATVAVGNIGKCNDCAGVKPRQSDWVRCPNHANGGATSCPRGGAALQVWQRKQWGN